MNPETQMTLSPSLQVPIVQLPHGLGLPLPSYATPGAAGLDLMAALAKPLILAPLARTLVPSGISIALPQGYEAQIRPRSGLALKQGVTVLNAPGTIDSDYRGEIGILLINLGALPFTIERGERIAQLVLAPIQSLTWEAREILPESQRGEGGFGSTGQKAKGELPHAVSK